MPAQLSDTYLRALAMIGSSRRRVVVTGAAGFIGSHLVTRLLQLGQEVVGIDNLSTGRWANLEDVQRNVGPDAWQRFQFERADIRDIARCRRVMQRAQWVFHDAALTSVGRSWKEPIATISTNVVGFTNILHAANDVGAERVVYASSSSVYGDAPVLPKHEHATGEPLSPYAATKAADEAIAEALVKCGGIPAVGLRYFNVFGPRQDASSPYAAVIPSWIESMLAGEPCTVYGDGSTSRDFSYVENIVQANVLAITTTNPDARGRVFNVGTGERTTLLEVVAAIKASLARHGAAVPPPDADTRLAASRPGDVRHSQADLELASSVLGYQPTHGLDDGLDETTKWHVAAHRSQATVRRAS